MRKLLVAWIVCGCLAVIGLARAEDKGDALLDLLIKKGTITQEEAAQVKTEWDKQLAAAIEKQDKTKVAKWIDEMKWYGDLRLRAEFFDNEDQTSTIDRWRYRFRLRFGLETKFQDWATLGLRVATGGEDPVSSNQSFQDTFSRKPIGIDLAYVTLQPPRCEGFKLTGGKMNNPIWQSSVSSPLVWDHDVTPEGIAEQLAWKFGDKKQHRLFANFGQFVLDEVSGDSNDPYLLEFQAGAEAKLGRVKFTAAGGYYQTVNLDGMGVASGSQPAAAATPGAQSTSPNRGNATAQPGGAGTTLFYLDDFQVVYGRAEAALTVSEKPLLGTPCVLTLSGEYAHNLAGAYEKLSGSTQTLSPDQTDGWAVQAAFGGNKKKGEWQVAYQYKYLEADATWDAITDSDFGLGGTDRKGHIVKASYNVRDWWQLGFAAFITEKISARPNSGENTRGLRGEELLRIQMDSAFKF
jgi:polyhydroxyalkanoate synthesis regulator phasin